MKYYALYRSIEEHIIKISAVPFYEDELQELQEFLLINLNFHKERKILSQAFLCPQNGNCSIVNKSVNYSVKNRDTIFIYKSHVSWSILVICFY